MTIDHNALCAMYEEAERVTADAREKSERDIDYRDGKQLTETEIATLNERGQPPVVYNRILRKIDYMNGLERQTRKDPKAFPRNPEDEGAANAATDGIRYACDQSKWDDTRSAVWDDMLVPGTGAVFVGVKKGRGGFDPFIAHIPWDRYFFDPASARPDFSDKGYDGIVTWYDLDKAIRKWPDKADLLNATVESGISADKARTYDDRPRENMWVDAKRKRVRVLEMYYLADQWLRCVLVKGGFLEDPAPSPYIDEEGAPENPIKARSLYVDRDNNRFGMVRVMIDPQDEINKRRSKGLHLITMRQVRASRGVSEDVEKIRREMAKPDGVIMAEDGEFEILPTNDMAMANLQLLQEAKNEIDLLGANAALSGKNENDLSGRALIAQQQGGMVEVARAFDRLRSLSIDVYRAVWNRIRQVWTEEKWIRVTDDPRNLRFVGLNQKVTVKMLAQEVAEGKPEAVEKAAQIVGPQVMQAYLQGDPQAQMMLGQFVQQNGDQVVETRNAINELDIDIVVDESMDTPTVAAEQFDAIIKMLPALGPAMQDPAKAMQLLQFVTEASQIRDKDKLIKILNEQPQVDPKVIEQQQQDMAMQRAGVVAQIEKTQSETARNLAQAQNGPDPVEHAFRAAELETDQFNAVTDRIQATQPEYHA